DITTSLYTALYFACIDWNGNINLEKDGILYQFLVGGNGGITARGFYYDTKPTDFDEFDALVPKSLTDSFKTFEHSKYFRIYKSSSVSPREVAQDGLFLVRGDLNAKAEFGTGFKFRIPAEAKMHILKQLWRAGYTPERMVRGERGVKAKENLGSILGLK
ncbi:MAG: hypothetical protein J7L21_04240, partial [Sulfurimonas sp.]|nr:hypothetical protein [Sulfurimonas sp.]